MFRSGALLRARLRGAGYGTRLLYVGRAACPSQQNVKCDKNVGRIGNPAGSSCHPGLDPGSRTAIGVELIAKLPTTLMFVELQFKQNSDRPKILKYNQSDYEKTKVS